MNFVVTADWLAKNLEDPQIVLVDCRFSLADPLLGHQQYELDHIPGAYYLDLNQDLAAPVLTHGGRHPLPDPLVFAKKLEQLGVDFDRTLVVAYDDSKFAFAARLWWLMRYCGHERVAVLDGGYRAWQAAGLPVASDLPPQRAGHFIPQVRTDWIVDIAAVSDPSQKTAQILIDSREADRYAGLVEPIDPVAGHIPGAVNYPWASVTDSAGFVLPTEQQKERWADLPQEPRKIVYCGSGVTACVNILSLTLADIPNILLYPGSWSDWCSYL